MTSSHKIIALCLCTMLASFGVFVEAGQGMGGLLGGGHHGGHGGLETLLVAGLLAKLLKGHGHGHGHHGHGGLSYGRSAGSYGASAPLQYGLAFPHGYGY